MVALTILSLVLLGTVSALRTLGNTQGSLERVGERVDEIRSVSEFLRDLMESAVVGSGESGLSLGGGGRGATYFRLGDGFLEWKTNLLFGEAYGGTHIVRIAAEQGQLMLRWVEPSATGLDDSQWQQSPSRPLVNNLEDLVISLRPEFGSDWVASWEESAVAPALVRLQIKSSGRHWPDLIMQVQR
jgi:general secretion pathway protein J